MKKIIVFNNDSFLDFPTGLPGTYYYELDP